MNPFHLTDEQSTTALRAMRAVALADGPEESHERALLEAAAKALGVGETALDGLRPLDESEAARVGGDEALRTRLLQAMMVMAMMDGEVSEAELGVLRRFARALGVDEPRLANLRQYSRGHVHMMQLDLSRRSGIVRDAARAAWAQGGARRLARFFGSFVGVGGEDRATASRYRELGLLPEGTLGRAYWAHMTARRFSFPGEAGIVMPEEFVKHDLAHVLGGYDTDAAGEVDVIAFVAGFLRTDPFWYVFSILAHMHLDVRIFGLDPTARLAADPARMIRALERGLAVNRDLYDPSIDWFRYFPRTVDEVRREFNVLPS